MLRLILAVSLSLIGTVGTADTMKTYKVVAQLGKKSIKNVPCKLVANGQTTELRTPASVKLPAGKDGIASIDSLSCSFGGKTLTTDTLVEARTVSVTFDFEKAEGLVGSIMYKKSNGGLVAFYTPSGRLLFVR